MTLLYQKFSVDDSQTITYSLPGNFECFTEGVDYPTNGEKFSLES